MAAPDVPPVPLEAQAPSYTLHGHSCFPVSTCSRAILMAARPLLSPTTRQAEPMAQGPGDGGATHPR